ncbi:MAG: phytanoyl-CoA dioxygenase family protein [Alphaproteobacteria bacterium]|nr:phytanoyl-CoA dioxygenase family protein [Alphaproteobacteria bacterium]MBU0798431.1 phytanoyl-CoA dioxygenase family protein [Alphaproteobacteria bacterium]MBU0887498.1 phytanoyl-CoA dioxygenase family protein [Alphaproteobacteria bacterium]MBU1813293.1 phytanoyl-CoA dioxygenase family protein [Alphaproteobacteria bacterium]MBU2089692.1 phytanoyl-CoA dioxygenase family protein [Alphaproteobacteria bacterium]
MTGSLTAAEVEHFQSQGYFVKKRALSAAHAAELRARIEAFEETLGEECNVRMKIKAHVVSPWMTDLARHPAILDAVESLLGPDIMLFGSSMFAKSAQSSKFVSWHQDSAYYGLTPNDSVTVWVAFTPSNKANGCLRVLPGSHLGPEYEHDETYDPQNLLARGQTIHGLDDDKAAYLELEPGEFSMHHVRTAHGSLGNFTDDRRIGLAFFYIGAHVASTLGRRTALLMRGEDRHGHWDADPVPRIDLDPKTLQFLTDMWGRYQSKEIQQAAKAGRV